MTRTKRIALGLAISAFSVSAFGTSAANATETPAPITFDTGALKLAGSNTALDIVAPANPVAITASVCLVPGDMAGCPTSGAAAGDFRVTPANFGFVPFTANVSASPNVDATVDLIPTENINGHLTTATGQVDTVVSNYTADITLSGAIAGNCVVTPIPIAWSTENNTPFDGDRFDTPTLANPQNGVIVDDWATLPAATGANPVACAVLNAFTDGPGGLALGDGIEPVLTVTPPPVAQQPTNTNPPATVPGATNKKCKKGQKLKKGKCVKKKKKKKKKK